METYSRRWTLMSRRKIVKKTNDEGYLIKTAAMRGMDVVSFTWTENPFVEISSPGRTGTTCCTGIPSWMVSRQASLTRFTDYFFPCFFPHNKLNFLFLSSKRIINKIFIQNRHWLTKWLFIAEHTFLCFLQFNRYYSYNCP